MINLPRDVTADLLEKSALTSFDQLEKAVHSHLQSKMNVPDNSDESKIIG